jgi:hypothetical protein
VVVPTQDLIIFLTVLAAVVEQDQLVYRLMVQVVLAELE